MDSLKLALMALILAIAAYALIIGEAQDLATKTFEPHNILQMSGGE